ncbi:MAG: hypothetical protein K8R56_05925 [Candidatus Eisenbacteria bacterium]|nr:hypothetical protein [Candidatus Eisenbacteria bacterium]
MTVRTRRTLRVALLLTLALGACAPPPPGSLEALEVTARRGAERREQRYAVCDARGILRIDGRSTGKLPGVTLRVRVASPDRARLQASWLLGTLADVAVRSDSLIAWVPAERLGLAFGGLADTLGVREPARFLAQAMSASWVAPRDAWRSASLDSTGGVTLAWRGSADEQWTLRVDHDGRPLEVSVARDGRSVGAKVSGWQGRGDDAWPARLELADGGGQLRARLEFTELRAAKRARASWFALSPPDDARTLTLPDLQRLWNTRGEAR